MATTEASAAPVQEDTPKSIVAGKTTEQVLRDLLPVMDPESVHYPVIVALVARYDAKAAKRAAKGSGDEGEG